MATSSGSGKHLLDGRRVSLSPYVKHHCPPSRGVGASSGFEDSLEEWTNFRQSACRRHDAVQSEPIDYKSGPGPGGVPPESPGPTSMREVRTSPSERALRKVMPERIISST